MKAQITLTVALITFFGFSLEVIGQDYYVKRSDFQMLELLTLFEDSTFRYSNNMDPWHGSYFSEGKWTEKGDTLFLSSEFSKDSFLVDVVFEFDPTSDTVCFIFSSKKFGYPMPGIFSIKVFINEDLENGYDIIFLNKSIREGIIKKESIKSISFGINFSGNGGEMTKSEVFYPSRGFANKYLIEFDLPLSIGYIFLENEKCYRSSKSIEISFYQERSPLPNEKRVLQREEL